MTEVVYTPRVLNDIDRLESFFLEVDMQAARHTIPLILSAIETLSLHPQIGRRRGGPTRELVISRGKTGYVALYRYDEIRDVARVLAIRYQRELGER